MAVERGQAMQGETVILRIRFELGGTLFNPFQINDVQILDASDVLVDTIPAASVVHDGLGMYHANWAIPAAEPTELHHDKWYAKATLGADTKQFELSFFVLPFSASGAGSPYLTTSELAAFLPSDTALTGAEIAALGLLAQEVVESITGQRFLPAAGSRVFDGSGRQVLPLDQPIQSWSKLEYLYRDSGWTDVTPANSYDLRITKSKRMLSLDNAVSFSQGSRRGAYNDGFLSSLGGACGVFPAGTQNVRVTGTWGHWSSVPLEIKQAVGMLVRYAASCDDPLGMPGAALASETPPGGRSYQIRQVLFSAKRDRLTGFSDVDSLLLRFPRFSPMVTVL